MKLLLVAVLAALSLISCKKKSDALSSGTRVKTNSYQSGSTSYTQTFTYDNTGKVMLITVPALNSRNEYMYTPNKIVLKRYSGATLTDSMVYSLGASGYVDTAVSYDDFGPEWYYSFKYDVAGHLIQANIYSDPGILESRKTYTYQADNLISEVASNGVGTISYTYNYSYDNTNGNSIGNDNTGQPYLGRSSKNVVVTAVRSGSGASTANMFYTYDQAGRIATINVKNAAGALVATQSVTYY